MPASHHPDSRETIRLNHHLNFDQIIPVRLDSRYHFPHLSFNLCIWVLPFIKNVFSKSDWMSSPFHVSLVDDPSYSDWTRIDSNYDRPNTVSFVNVSDLPISFFRSLTTFACSSVHSNLFVFLSKWDLRCAHSK